RRMGDLAAPHDALANDDPPHPPPGMVLPRCDPDAGDRVGVEVRGGRAPRAPGPAGSTPALRDGVEGRAPLAETAPASAVLGRPRGGDRRDRVRCRVPGPVLGGAQREAGVTRASRAQTSGSLSSGLAAASVYAH